MTSSITMHHRYLFDQATFSFTQSLISLDGTEDRRHISKKLGHDIFYCHQCEDSWHSSDSNVYLLILILQS